MRQRSFAAEAVEYQAALPERIAQHHIAACPGVDALLLSRIKRKTRADSASEAGGMP